AVDGGGRILPDVADLLVALRVGERERSAARQQLDLHKLVRSVSGAAEGDTAGGVGGVDIERLHTAGFAHQVDRVQNRRGRRARQELQGGNALVALQLDADVAGQLAVAELQLTLLGGL